jgi:hypothetical protein
MVRSVNLRKIFFVFSMILLFAVAESPAAEKVFAGDSANNKTPESEKLMNSPAPENFLPPSFRKKAHSFELEDQFGKKLSVKFPTDKVTILIFGDREGSAQIERWVRPLYGRYTNSIYIFGVAELSAAPWIARPFVRGIIKSKSRTPIMLDWSGNVSKNYGYEKGKANLFVVDKAGNIIAEKRGAATASALSDLYRTINRVL